MPSERARGIASGLSAAVEVLRLRHWIKNAILFLPLLFGLRFRDGSAWLHAAMAAIAFGLVASALYILNDIFDRRSDRHHPAKKDRPLASGRMSLSAAVVEMLLVLAAGALVAATLPHRVAVFLLAYVLLQLAYNISLKRRVLLDAICLALGFVLRAVVGAVVIGVVPSPWLIVCTFSLCLFLGFCKRHCEILADNDAETVSLHRSTLRRYTPGLLNHLITMSGTIAVISFMIYATHAETMRSFGTDYFVYTLPLVVYGVCRIAMLSMQGRYSDPTELLLCDRPIQITGVLWLLSAVVIVVYGRAIQGWFASITT